MKFGLDLTRTTIEQPGLKILNAHPILIYLNSPSDNHRRSVTWRCQNLVDAPKAEIDAERNAGRGIGDVWREMFADFSARNIRTHTLKDALING